MGAGFPLGNKIIVAAGAADTSFRFPTPLHGLLLPSIALLIAGVTLSALRASSRQKQMSVHRIWLMAAVVSVASINIALLLYL